MAEPMMPRPIMPTGGLWALGFGPRAPGFGLRASRFADTLFALPSRGIAVDHTRERLWSRRRAWRPARLHVPHAGSLPPTRSLRAPRVYWLLRCGMSHVAQSARADSPQLERTARKTRG